MAADPASDLEEALAVLAQNNALLTVAMASFATSQSSFMRSAADADANIGLSISHPLLLSEELAARDIDNTVDDSPRNGMAAADRDLRPSMPRDYVYDTDDDDYDSLDPRHGTDWGLGHHEYSTDRADRLTAWHRTRGRNIRAPERQLPADGYMSTFSSPVDQLAQWKGHPLALTGSLNEEDVRKGEYTMSKFLNENLFCRSHLRKPVL